MQKYSVKVLGKIMDYKKIKEIYWKKLQEQSHNIVLLTHKWSDSDLLYPFSDLDLRIITKDIVDSFDLNEKLYQAHYNAVKETEYGDRILEHPVGLMYTETECLHQQIYEIDFVKTSFINGDKNLFVKTQNAIKPKKLDTTWLECFFLNDTKDL